MRKCLCRDQQHSPSNMGCALLHEYALRAVKSCAPGPLAEASHSREAASVGRLIAATACAMRFSLEILTLACSAHSPRSSTPRQQHLSPFLGVHSAHRVPILDLERPFGQSPSKSPTCRECGRVARAWIQDQLDRAVHSTLLQLDQRSIEVVLCHSISWHELLEILNHLSGQVCGDELLCAYPRIID